MIVAIELSTHDGSPSQSCWRNPRPTAPNAVLMHAVQAQQVHERRAEHRDGEHVRQEDDRAVQPPAADALVQHERDRERQHQHHRHAQEQQQVVLHGVAEDGVVEDEPVVVQLRRALVAVVAGVHRHVAEPRQRVQEHDADEHAGGQDQQVRGEHRPHPAADRAAAPRPAP